MTNKTKIIININDKTGDSSVISPYTTEATLSILQDLVEHLKKQK